MPRWFLVAVLTVVVSCLARAEDVVDRFAQAPPEFSPVPIWWWSGDPVTPEGVTWQLERMAAGGIHNVIVLNLAPSGPLYGSAPDEPPFLSEDWWALFGHAVAECERLGVRMWFYDQLGFSGAGLQARLVRDHPEFRGVTLERAFEDVEGPANVEIAAPPTGTALAAFTARLARDAGEAAPAQWVWDPAAGEGEVRRYFRNTFLLLRVPEAARVRISADNGYVLYVNGEKVGEESVYDESGWRHAEAYDITGLLRVGENVIAAEGINLGGPGGLILEAERDGEVFLASGETFRMSAEPAANWVEPGFDDHGWGAAVALGSPPVAPWGGISGLRTVGGRGLGTRLEQVQPVPDAIQEGVLRVEVPAGRHRVMLFYTAPGGFDYQNPAAGAALIDVVHGEMERRFGAKLGKSIAGSFQDEFPAVPRFSMRMPAVFRERMGYDLLAVLPALYDDVVDRFGDPAGPDTVQVRCDANDIAAALNEEAFFIPLHEWHERYGMLCGYDQTVRNADPLRGEQYYVDYFKTQRHYSVPGNDMDGDIKPHQSIADLYQRPRVWMEAFHSSGWGQTMEETAVLLHPWVVEGATLFNPHAIYYSIHGSYWEWAPPDTGWRQPYFAHYRQLADYVARLTYALASGRHVVRVGLLHPASTVHAYSGFGSPAAQAREAQAAYWAVQAELRARRVDYLIVDEDSVLRGEIADGRLAVGDVALDTIVLPSSRVLRAETVARLRALTEQGGRVGVVGALPAQPADAARAPGFADDLQALLNAARTCADAAACADFVEEDVPPVAPERKPVLHRRLEGRDLFFVMSDEGTVADGHARWAINDRELWNTDAGRGAVMGVTLPGDGLPEMWDALTGTVAPIRNFERLGEATRVTLDLSATPAPLVALRPATEGIPVAVDSDLEILSIERTENGVDVVGLPRADALPDSARHTVRVAYADAAYEGSVPARAPVTLRVEGPLACSLEPTLDNHDGSFAWPPSGGTVPVEVRAFRYRPEMAGEDTAAWRAADYDDSEWDTVVASFGPRAAWTGPVDLPEGQKLDTLGAPPETGGPWEPVVYSLRLGIDEDRVFSSALGGKGRIPEEFIDLGQVRGRKVYLVRAVAVLPESASSGPLPAVLRVGGEAAKRAFLNGVPVVLDGESAARSQEGEVVLQPGANELVLAASRPHAGHLRLFYQFLPAGTRTATPEWIWSREPNPEHRTRFACTVALPEDAGVADAGMVAALGGLHQIYVNGARVADQGNFDAYFMSRAEHYDIKPFLRPGENVVEVIADDTGHPAGLFVDGLVTLADGTRVPFVSGPSWLTTPAGQPDAEPTPARTISGPAQGYMGDPAMLRLWTRPHPLPYAGWLADQPPPEAPFDRLVYARSTDAPPAAWYRFRVPPGATGLRLHLPEGARARLFINGTSPSLRGWDGVLTAALPDPDAPVRVAALRIESVPGYEAGAAVLEPVTFDVGPGRIPLGSWDELGLPHYSGGVVHEMTLSVNGTGGARWTLDLGRVRGSVEVEVNGEPCGTRIWHPYRFDVSDALAEGENQVTVKVYNTLGPHFGVGHPSAHVYKGHTQSGIFGPITLSRRAPVRLRLVKQ